MYYVYILTNTRKTVTYTGCTNDLKKRIYFHKQKLIPGFTKKYKVDQLIYWESFDEKKVAFAREKQIKSYSRAILLALLNCKLLLNSAHKL